MSLLIKNGSIVYSNKIEKADILVKNGKIEKIGQSLQGTGDIRIVDASDKFVFAGFIDMHTHLREPGFEYKEDITSGTRSAIKGGFTSICAMPNTSPVIDNAPLVKFVKVRGEEENLARVFPIGAITKGQKGEELAELKTMADFGAVAFSDDGNPVENGGLMKKALEYAKSFDLLLISHSEDKSIAGDGVVNEGESATRAGLNGISRVAEEAMVARDILLAESIGARVHIAHVSTSGSVELLRQAKKRGVRVTAETCPHYFSLTDKEILNYNTNAKINPPLREKGDVRAIIEGLKDGTIDVIATDHAPHSKDEKSREFDYAPFGSTGLETAFAVSYTHLVKTGELKLEDLARLLSKNPAKILNLPFGEIKEGAICDITIADINKSFTVDSQRHTSKGKNSVFNGKKLMGEIAYTIVEGEIK